MQIYKFNVIINFLIQTLSKSKQTLYIRLIDQINNIELGNSINSLLLYDQLPLNKISCK